MNDHEKVLVDLLAAAPPGKPDQPLKAFEKYYWLLDEEAIPWDTPLGKALHDFADAIEFFEPDEAAREEAGILFGEEELASKIKGVLKVVPSDQKSSS